MSTPTPVRAEPGRAAGARAWELMYEVFRASKPWMEQLASQFELTPQQVFALRNVAIDKPLAMSELATLLGCDASNVTAIVDKLESRGLVERRSYDRDRRVKAILMTPSGLALQERVLAGMEQPPPALANLSPQDVASLCSILERALASIAPLA